MAIFNFHLSALHRGAGASLFATAAYQGRCVLHDIRTGVTHDYVRKGGHLAGGTIGWDPDDFSGLLTALEAAEKHPRAILGRKIDAALPHELPTSTHIRIVNGFGLWLRDRHRVAVLWDIHAPDKDGSPLNTHVHFLVSSRVVEDGQIGKKTRELDVLPSGAEHITAWRQEWERRVNRELERAGLAARVDARSLSDRAAGTGFHLEPMEHLGPARSRIERRGQATSAGDRNRRRLAERRELKLLLAERASLSRQITAWNSITDAAEALRGSLPQSSKDRAASGNKAIKGSSLRSHDDTVDSFVHRLIAQKSDRDRTALAAEAIRFAVAHHPTDWPHKLGRTVKAGWRGLPRGDRHKIKSALIGAARSAMPMTRALNEFLTIFVEHEHER